MNNYVTRQEFQKVFTILERIESKVDGIETKLEEHDRRFDEHDRRFDEIHVKLEEHDRRFDSHDRSFLAINTTFAAIDVRFDKVEESVRHEGVMRERLEKKVDTIVEHLGRMATKQDVENLRAEIVPRLDMLESVMRSR